MPGALGDVSNARPAAYKAAALPAELRGLVNPLRLCPRASIPSDAGVSLHGVGPDRAHPVAAITIACGRGVHGHTRSGADDEHRTRGLGHGVAALFLLSYIRFRCETTPGQYRGRLAATC